MKSVLQRLRNPARGVGRISYPLRTFAYTYEVTMVCLYAYTTQGFDLGTCLMIGLLVVYPHFAHLAYKYADSNPKVAVAAIYLDAVIAGAVIVAMDFNVFNAFTLSLLSIANVISVKGLKRVYIPVLGILLRILLAVIPHGFVVSKELIPAISIISSATVFLYYVFFATQVFRFASKSRTKTKVIKTQQQELSVQHEQLQNKTDELKVTINHLKDSMNYARTIQHAMLPTLDRFYEIFDDGFIFFRPLQELSGDYYWFEEVDEVKIFAAVDCTGHGIPGALMSMLGSDMLLEIVRVRKITNPAEILREMHEAIIRVLNQRETQNSDGMDVAICAYDTRARKLSFSGANSPLFWVSDGEITEVKGCRKGVGGYDEGGERHYSRHEFEVKGSGVIYLASDGYKDQFGGENEKKFSKKSFRELLLQHYQAPVRDQHAALNRTMDRWMKGHDQVDDMLVMGVSIS